MEKWSFLFISLFACLFIGCSKVVDYGVVSEDTPGELVVKFNNENGHVGLLFSPYAPIAILYDDESDYKKMHVIDLGTGKVTRMPESPSLDWIVPESFFSIDQFGPNSKKVYFFGDGASDTDFTDGHLYIFDANSNQISLVNQDVELVSAPYIVKWISDTQLKYTCNQNGREKISYNVNYGMQITDDLIQNLSKEVGWCTLDLETGNIISKEFGPLKRPYPTWYGMYRIEPVTVDARLTHNICYKERCARIERYMSNGWEGTMKYRIVVLGGDQQAVVTDGWDPSPRELYWSSDEKLYAQYPDRLVHIPYSSIS